MATILPSIHDMFPEHLFGDLPAIPSHPFQRPRQLKMRAAASQRGRPPTRSRARSEDSVSDHGSDDSERRHICELCQRRFNRPSSLRIHMNTHTGATPFKCPFPTCGRSFNVNSNMRRHYRNHKGGDLLTASHITITSSPYPSSPPPVLLEKLPTKMLQSHLTINRSAYVWSPPETVRMEAVSEEGRDGRGRRDLHTSDVEGSGAGRQLHRRIA